MDDLAEGSPAAPTVSAGGENASSDLLERLGFALVGARTVDDVVRCVLTDLVRLPGVRRVGIALSEGGGRSLRFVASDGDLANPLPWCHIDAYDEVPLTTVVRTGVPIMAGLDDFGDACADFVAWQRTDATQGVAAIPLPDSGSPIGGLVLSFDEPQSFAEPQRRLLEAAARRTAEALRRARQLAGRDAPAPGEEVEVAEGVRVAVTTLDNDPRAVGAARRFLRRELDGWTVEGDLADTAQVCLSELGTNAVIHAESSSQVRITLDGAVLTVMVRDQGGPGPMGETTPPDDEDPMRVHGRGLLLVDALAARWGSERDADGTTVWFDLELGREQDESVRTG